MKAILKISTILLFLNYSAISQDDTGVFLDSSTAVKVIRDLKYGDSCQSLLVLTEVQLSTLEQIGEILQSQLIQKDSIINVLDNIAANLDKQIYMWQDSTSVLVQNLKWSEKQLRKTKIIAIASNVVSWSIILILVLL